ncbi:MAG: lysophospholipid acyltransferase family protein [Pseudomonadota bacterium]
MLFLRSLLFYIGISLALLIFAPLGVLLFPLPFRQRYRVMNGWARFAIWWLEKTCQLNYQVQGLENIPATPAIVLGKHQSAWETIVFQVIFPRQVWLVKRELLRIPFFGWALASLQPIAIDRKNLRQSMQKIVEQGKQRLAEGNWVVIFPEGTRVAPGEKKRYGVGGAMLAAQSGYPVVPVAVNSGEFWPPKGFIKQPGTIKVVIGPVIESNGKTYKEINALTEKWIEEMVLKIQH